MFFSLTFPLGMKTVTYTYRQLTHLTDAEGSSLGAMCTVEAANDGIRW